MGLDTFFANVWVSADSRCIEITPAAKALFKRSRYRSGAIGKPVPPAEKKG